jgi:hypothetical protein
MLKELTWHSINNVEKRSDRSLGLVRDPKIGSAIDQQPPAMHPTTDGRNGA